MQVKLSWDEQLTNNTTEIHDFNWARHFSKVNRKALDQVDKDGNPLIYKVGIKQSNDNVSQSAIDTLIYTATNGYVTARAVKAWHRARLKMLKREGVSLKQLSPYSRQLRFPLVQGTPNYDSRLNRGEWTNTKISVESPLDSATGTGYLRAADIVDTYTLTLCGDHVKETSTVGEQKYTSVGIIASWLNARRKTVGTSVDGSDEEAIDHETNPLYNLLSGTMASEEVLEIVEESQKEEPPYSPTDDEHRDMQFQGSMYSSQHQADYTIIECPAGLMRAVITDQNADGGGSAPQVRWEIELLDVYPMSA